MSYILLQRCARPACGFVMVRFGRARSLIETELSTSAYCLPEYESTTAGYQYCKYHGLMSGLVITVHGPVSRT
jgi:hypothetical protein